jgi:tetratricopeptide (TPR) repeat protein
VIADIQHEQGHPLEALLTLDRALSLAEPFPPQVGQILVKKAELELEIGRVAAALALYQAALPVAQRTADLSLQARILRGMAQVHTQQGEEEQAAESLERAEALAPTLGEGSLVQEQACKVPP